MLDEYRIPVAVSTNYDAMDKDWQTEIRVQGTHITAADVDLSSIGFEWSAFDYAYDVFENIQKGAPTDDPKQQATAALAALFENRPDFQIMEEDQLPRPRKPM